MPQKQIPSQSRIMECFGEIRGYLETKENAEDMFGKLDDLEKFVTTSSKPKQKSIRDFFKQI